MGQDCLTDGGIKALSKLENKTSLTNYCKTGEMPRNERSCDLVIGLWPQRTIKESLREDTNISYKSATRVSSYDTVAVPCSLEQRRSAFKVKPSSISYIANLNNLGNSCINNPASTTFDAIPEN